MKKNNEKKYVVYERITDLTNEDTQILKQYDLKQAKYIYTGECEESRIKQRANDFIYKIYNKTNEDLTGINIELETAITYQNIIRFFIEHKGMTKQQAEDYLFRSNECRIIKYRDLNKDEAKLLEKKLHNQYILEQSVNNKLHVFENRACQLKIENENDSTHVKTKYKSVKNKNLQSPTVEIVYENNKFYFKINEQIMELQGLTITPIIKQEELLNLDIKKPSKSAKLEGENE